MTPILRSGLAITAAWLLVVGPRGNVTEARGDARTAQQPSNPAPPRPRDLEVLQLRPNFFMIAGAGGNIGVQVGDDGVVVVDAGSAARADAVVAAIKKLTPRPIRYVINTSADPDHVGGNETLSKAGQTLFTAPGSIGVTGNFLGGAASILSAEQVLERMSAPTGQASPFPVGALADRNLRSRAEVHVPQRRRHRGAASAGGAHRRRRAGLLPPFGCGRGRRHPGHDALPGDRRGQGRHASTARSRR